jgi:methionine-rich copper-binding protein CopC
VEDGATGVVPNGSITFLFSSQMNLSSLDAATTITDNGALPKSVPAGSWSQGDGTHAVLSFNPALNPNHSYTIDIAATAQTQQGTALGAAFQLNFSTGSADQTPPNLISITPADGSTIPANTSSIVMTFDEAIQQDHFDPSMLSAQFQLLIAVNQIDPVWSGDGTQLTVPLPTPLPAGLPIVVRFDSYQDLAGNVQTTPIEYRVDVAGTPSYWPEIGGELQAWFESWTDQPTGGQPNSGTGTLYRRYVDAGGDNFDMEDYSDYAATMHESTDHYRMTSNAVRLLGFTDYNDGTSSTTTLDPSVEYMRLPVKVETWSGSTSATSTEGTATINYTVHVIGKEDLSASEPNKIPIPQPSVAWVDTWKSTLEYEFVVGGETFQSGVDTLWFAPAAGFVQRSSHETSADGVYDSFEKYFGPANLLK